MKDKTHKVGLKNTFNPTINAQGRKITSFSFLAKFYSRNLKKSFELIIQSALVTLGSQTQFS